MGTLKDTQESPTEDLLEVVGGSRQVALLLVLIIASFPFAAHNMAMTFYAPNLQHFCARTPSAVNLTVEEWKRTELPPHDNKCHRYDDPTVDNVENSTRKIIACSIWEYDEERFGKTLMPKFDLVCNRRWLVSFSKSIFNVGLLVSSFLLGYLSDKFGRLPVMVAANAITLLASFISAFSVSFLMFAVCRFFIAIGIMALYNTSFVLMTETVSPKRRELYGSVKGVGWTAGCLVLPGITYLLRDWFWVQILLTLPSVLLLCIGWVLPESPRWLLSRGKTDAAHTILRKMAISNGICPNSIESRLQKILENTTMEHQSEEKVNKFLLLIRSPELRKNTLNIFYLWFVIAFVYYGISYNTNELSGDPYVNFSVSAAVKFPCILVAWMVMRWAKRRWTFCPILILLGICCVIIYFVPQDMFWLSATLFVTSKMCIAVVFTVVYVYTAEVFPTSVRNAGLGAANSFARLASIVAPFVRELAHANHPLLPQVLFGVLAVTGGLLVLLLPETKDINVPDTLRDARVNAERGKSNKHEKKNGNAGTRYAVVKKQDIAYMYPNGIDSSHELQLMIS